MPKMICVDGSNLLKRAYHGARCDSAEGAARVAASMLAKVIRRHQPTHAVVAMDSPVPTRRHALDPQYKATREQRGPSTAELTDAFRPVLEAQGIACVGHPGEEADDVIATLVARAWEKGTDVLVLSRDKDLLALADRCTVIWPENDGAETVMDAGGVYHFLGVQPYQIPAWKALAGDASDNIPRLGWTKEERVGKAAPFGFTEHRAARLLSFGALHTMLDTPHLMPHLMRHEVEWLTAGRERALLNLRLATLREDVPLTLEASATRVRQPA